MLAKQNILLGKGTRVESRRVREPRRTALTVQSLGFCGDGISFQVVFSQSSDSESFLVVQPRWMPARIQGGGRICGASF